MQKQLEHRSWGKFAHSNGKLVGYAAVFGPLSENLGGFRERIDSRAFDKALADGRDIRALVDHDNSKVLGRRSVNTLRLSKDEHGLRVEIDLPETTYANDLRALLKRGDVSQMSFGFFLAPNGDKWEKPGEDGLRIRTLLDVELIEVSVVTMPAYPDTSAMLRALPQTVLLQHSRNLWLAKNRLPKSRLAKS